MFTGGGYLGKAALAAVVASLLTFGGMAYSPVMAADNTAGSGKGVAIGTNSNAPKSENVAIGKGATISYSSGASSATGDIVVGDGANINNYASQGGSIAIGKNAKVENMAGGGEASFAFGQTTFSGGWLSSSRIPADPSKVVGSIAIGDNTFARTGSTMIGSHNYKGDLGDTTVDSATTRTYALNVYATTIGANSFSNGAFTTNTGAYNIISSDYNGGRSANPVKNMGATITGALNSIESIKDAGYYSGIANTVSGIANRTSNSNGTLIYGAGNEVTNSITDLTSTPTDSGKSAKDFAEKLRTSIKESKSGGATLVIGGGNVADYTQKTQILGVNNTVTGTENNISDYNMIDGFGNTITGASHLYTIGTNNKITNTKNTILAGDDYTNVSGLTDSVIIGNNRVSGKDDNAAFASFKNQKNIVSIGNKNVLNSTDGSISIGNNNFMWRSGGKPDKYGYDTGNVAIGNNTYINSYLNQGDSIVIGKNATAMNMGGSLEKAFAFGTPEGKDYSGSIAIGQNSYARSGSTMIGIHNYQGKLGDLDIDFKKGKNEGSSGIANYQESIDATTIGNNSYNNGVFSTVVGSYTAVSGLYHNEKWGEKPYGVQNFGAAVLGSLNSVEGLTSTEHNTAGMADSILGSANRTKNANGTIMVGAGNVVEDSINDFDASEIKTKDGIASPNALSDAMRTSIKNANGGGAAAIVGNGNEVKQSTNVSVLGSKNKLTKTKSAQVLGDNREVTDAEGAVIIGSASGTTPLTTDKKNVTILGYNANATVEGGVAIGSGSIANVGAGQQGYYVKHDQRSEEGQGYPFKNNDSAWISRAGAVSVGDTTNEDQSKWITRQITGVAAGTNDTDAVNVAQLKNSQTRFYSIYDPGDNWLGILPQIPNWEKYKNADNQGAQGYWSMAAGFGTSSGDGAAASTVIGSFSRIDGEWKSLVPTQGATSVSVGSFNFNLSDPIKKIDEEDPNSIAKGNDYSGTANSIVGQANLTKNSNGALIYGAGNVITDSYQQINDNGLTDLFSQKMDGLLSDPVKAIKTIGQTVAISGGKMMVMGGGNVADKAYDSQIMGVGNTITGDAIKFDYKESPEVSNLPEDTWDEQIAKTAAKQADVWNQYMEAFSKQGTRLNYVDGYYSTLKNGQNDYLIGTANEVTGDDASKNKSNIVFGDYHKLKNGNNNIIIGSADGSVVNKAKGFVGDDEYGIKTSQEITQKQHTENLVDAVMIGHNADVQKNGGVALGAESVASVDRDVVGYDPSGTDHSGDTTGVWKSKAAAVSVGQIVKNEQGQLDAEKTITRQITNVAAGKELTDAVNVAQLKSAQIHYYSMKVTQESAEGDKSNYNNDGATGEGSIAIGPFASAKGNHSLALGYNAETTHLEGEDDQDDNTAVGYNSQAGYRSTALGYRSQATGGRAVALGTDALADKDNSSAVGMNAQATGKQATALGSLAKANGESATAVGEYASALSDNSSAVGQGAIVEAGASEGTALGHQAKVLAGAVNSMALGASSQVSGANSIAIGMSAQVSSAKSVAIGQDAKVSVENSVALGQGSVASGNLDDYNVMSLTIPNLGSRYNVSGGYTSGIVSVGNDKVVRTITNVAAGRVTSDSTDAVNGSELYAVATEAAKHATVKAAANSRITVNNTGKNQGLGIEYTIGLNTDGLAALTDGLKFAGDDGQSDPGKVISRKLNEQLNIIGGAADTVDANNIGVVKTTDNTLNIRLAKDITGLNSLQATTVTSGKVTVDGQHNVITGLFNTEWNEGQDYSQSTKAATEAQIQKAMKQAAADANDTHIKAGDYAVGAIKDKNGQSVQGVSIDVVDKTGKVGTVRITDVAKASDVGDVTNLNADIKNATGKTTVVDAVNHVDNKVGNLDYSSTKYVKKGEDVTTSIGKLDEAIKYASEAAGKHTIVSTKDSNLSVENIAPKGEAANYQISLNKNLNVDSVTAANKITTKDLEVTGSATIGKVTINKDDKGTIGGLTNKTWDAKNITSGQAATEDQLQAATKNAVNYDGDDSKTVTLREDTTIKNVADTTIEEGSKNAVNAGTVYNETRVAKDGNFVKQANTAGENLSALDNQVTANTESIYHINNRVSDLDNRVNKVGAGAAALAALHPLDFDPDDKWDFAVGYGNYRNANSVAFGAFYRPNEDTMFSLGTNFGNGENMFNAGLSFKIGQGGSGITTSKTAMAKTISSLKDTVHKQDKKIEGLENVVDTQDKKIAELEALVKEQGEMIRQYVGKK